MMMMSQVIFKMNNTHTEHLPKCLIFSAENWCKTFYRTVDSLPSPSGKVLRKLEARVFQSQKASILKELKDKEWTGSKEQNSFADEKISSVVRRVLKFD